MCSIQPPAELLLGDDFRLTERHQDFLGHPIAVRAHLRVRIRRSGEHLPDDPEHLDEVLGEDGAGHHDPVTGDAGGEAAANALHGRREPRPVVPGGAGKDRLRQHHGGGGLADEVRRKWEPEPQLHHRHARPARDDDVEPSGEALLYDTGHSWGEYRAYGRPHSEVVALLRTVR